MNQQKEKHTINQLIKKDKIEPKEDIFEYYEPEETKYTFWQLIKDTIKSLYCKHDWGSGKLNAFRDCYGNYSAIYTCSKCGKNKVVVFGKNWPN